MRSLLALVAATATATAAEPAAWLPADAQLVIAGDLARLRTLAPATAPTAAWEGAAWDALTARLDAWRSVDPATLPWPLIARSAKGFAWANLPPAAPDIPEELRWRQVFLLDESPELGLPPAGDPKPPAWLVGPWNGALLGRSAWGRAGSLTGMGNAGDLARTAPGAGAAPPEGAPALWWRARFRPTYDLIQQAEDLGAARYFMDGVLPGWRELSPVATCELIAADGAWGSRLTLTGCGQIPGHVPDPAIAASLPQDAPLRLVAGFDPGMAAQLLRNFTPPDAYAALAQALGAGPGEIANLLSGDVGVVVRAPGIPPDAGLVIGLRPGADPTAALGVLAAALQGRSVETAGRSPDLALPTRIGEVLVRVRAGRIAVATAQDLLDLLTADAKPGPADAAPAALTADIDLPRLLGPFAPFLATGAWKLDLPRADGSPSGVALDSACLPQPAALIAALRPWRCDIRLTPDGCTVAERGTPLIAAAATWAAFRVLDTEQRVLTRVIRDKGVPLPPRAQPKPGLVEF